MCLFLTACSSRKQVQTDDWKEPKPKSSNKGLIIWIDPGHGGKDPGASNRALKIQEKNIALKTAIYAKKKLVNMGYDARLTRSRDEFIPLEKRVDMANSHRKSLFVSIHFNSAKRKAAEGLEIYYHSLPAKASRVNHLSKILGESIEKETLKQLKIPSRGVRVASFRVIKDTKVPSCLIEGGFLTNPREAKKLSKNGYLEKLGVCIAEGIHTFCSKHEI